MQNQRLKNDRPLSVPFLTLYAVNLRIERQEENFNNPAIQYIIDLGGETNSFFPLHLSLTILVNSSIQVCARILVHPILIDAEERIIGGRKAKSWEVAVAS